MASNRVNPQSKEALLKSYNTRLKEDVRSMLENFEGEIHWRIRYIKSVKHHVSCVLIVTEIGKLAKGESESHQLSKITQCEQDTYEMQVRAANIVRAGESLMKLVSDIKQYLILNDFHSVNEAITANSQLFRSTQVDCDKKLMTLRDDMAADLYDLEEEYYTSVFKWDEEVDVICDKCGLLNTYII